MPCFAGCVQCAALTALIGGHFHAGNAALPDGGTNARQPNRYREFVERGLAEADADFRVALKESPRSIGGPAFRGWVDGLHQKIVETHRRPEDVAFRRITEPMTAETVMGILAEVFNVEIEEFQKRRRDSSLRGVAARFLYRYAGLTQREAADVLKTGSGAAISHQLRKLAVDLSKDRRLCRRVVQAEARLDERRQTGP